ncbi:MAG: four helix bundle protein [Paludibacteraceae bacterium]|nr:four helix bundle protein [Paludibacteraceae bacterium]
MDSKENNIIVQKTFDFAVRSINLYKHLCYKATNKEFIISKQLLRSGTSIGANIEEAIGGQSTADFISKLSIAYKEARESLYWIKLLYKTDYITDAEYKSLTADLDDIIKIIAKIKITTLKNTNLNSNS